MTKTPDNTEVETEDPKKLSENRRLGKKARGLRSKVKECGIYRSTDQLKSIITKKNVLKMIQFVPKRANELGGFAPEEFKQRFETAQEKVSHGALEVLAPRVDGLFRGLIIEAMNRAADFNRSTVDTTVMASVLRPYTKNTLFETAEPPPGILGYAFKKGILKKTEDDEKKEEKRNTDAAEQHEMEQKAQALRDANKAKRSAAYKKSGRTPGFAKKRGDAVAAK